MQDDELERLRQAYQAALEQYEVVAAALNRHIAMQTEPDIAERRKEHNARTQLDLARRLYMDALMR